MSLHSGWGGCCLPVIVPPYTLPWSHTMLGSSQYHGYQPGQQYSSYYPSQAAPSGQVQRPYGYEQVFTHCLFQMHERQPAPAESGGSAAFWAIYGFNHVIIIRVIHWLPAWPLWVFEGV